MFFICLFAGKLTLARQNANWFIHLPNISMVFFSTIRLLVSRKHLGVIILQATEDWKGEQEKNNKAVVISFMNMINVQRPKVFNAPEYTDNK